MKLSCRQITVCMLGLCIVPMLEGAEKRISQTDLPPAVQKAVHEQSKGATIKGYSQEVEHGQTLYEVEMIENGHSKDLSITPDGQVVEVEEQVELSSLPANLQHALKAKAGKGEISRVESITKGGKLVAFEAQLKGPGRHKEIQVDPEGNDLTHEE